MMVHESSYTEGYLEVCAQAGVGRWLSRLSHRQGRVVSFNDKDYIRALNDVMCLEQGVYAFYQHNLSYFKDSWGCETASTHRQFARQLAQLIRSQGGLPLEESTQLSAEVSLVLSLLSQRLGAKVATKTLQRLCANLESMLLKRYQNAWEYAPSVDRIILASMKHRIRHHQAMIGHLL